MSVLVTSIIIFIGSLFAGFIGSLTGLGGGIIIIPLLTLALGFDMNYAVGAALISVVATSTGSATAYIRDGFTNIKIGMYLLVATTIGAIIGAFTAMNAPTDILAIVFGLILAFTAIMSFRKTKDYDFQPQMGTLAHKMQLWGTYQKNGKAVSYESQNPIIGFLLMVFAGFMSGLLGIGSGVLKVLAMDNAMKLPFKVSTTTSSFMIGVTGIASAIIYLQKGYIVAPVAAPVLIGVSFGAMIGAKLLPKINTVLLKKIFAFVVSIVALQMIWKGISGNF